MATNNAINVPEGTTGQLLVGVTSAAPAFGSSAAADFTFTSATAGATRTLTVSNTDNTNTASTAVIVTSTAGASAGDAFHKFTTTTTSWSLGIDNSVTSPTADPFVISQSTALGTNNVMSVATSGEVNFPLQTAFLANLSSAQNGVTGDGTIFTIIYDTEIFDQNSDYNNATGVFTAPVTGKYFFTAQSATVPSTSVNGRMQLVTSSRTYSGQSFPSTLLGGNNWVYLLVTSLCDMDAADTCTAPVTFYNSTKTADVQGGFTTRFSGNLEC